MIARAHLGAWRRSTTRMLCDTRGQGLVEYALIIAFVAMIALAGMRFFAARAVNTLNNDAAVLPY